MSGKQPESSARTPWWNRWPTIIGASVIASALLVSVIGNWAVMPLITRGSKTIVPDLYQEDVAVAKRILNHRSLVFISDSSDYVWDEEVPANCVVSQEPSPYTIVKKGRRVRVVLSRGPRLYEVPAVVNRSAVEAGIRIEQQGFRIGIVRFSLRDADDRSDPFVVEQSPESGAMQPHRTSIDLVVSLAPHMPDLSGRGYEDAVQIIRMLGLQVGSTIYEKSEVLLPRSVVSQSVRPGQRIRRGDMVNLVLSHL